MRKAFLLIILGLLLSVSMVAAQSERQAVIVQWASSAAASSEYSDDSWSAEKVLGEPDVLACEDNANAWASSESSSEEYLAVAFDRAVIPTQVNIYQNLNPGSIIGIEIISSDQESTIPIPNTADPGTGCPGVFSINLPDDLPEAIGVVIYLDQSIIGSWNEIDAVELVGLVTGDPAKSMETSIESGEFDMYAVTNNVDTTSAGPTSSGGSSGPTGSGGTKGDTDTGGTTVNDYGGEWGTYFACSDGTEIVNGIDLTVIQQRGGGVYRVTAIGLGDFDPVLAVRDEFGNHLCNDDSSDGAGYTANLPSTGQIRQSGTTSQVLYSNNVSGFANITITAGGYGGMGGEFLVIVEGMVATSADGAGDPFSLYVSPALLESGVTPVAYNIAVTNAFDAVIMLIDSEYNALRDDSGSPIVCDDAGNSSLCWGDSSPLSGSYVSRSQNRQLAGGNLDAMLAIPMDSDTWGGYFNYVMTGNQSYGDYVAAFHLGTAQEP